MRREGNTSDGQGNEVRQQKLPSRRQNLPLEQTDTKGAVGGSKTAQGPNAFDCINEKNITAGDRHLRR